MPAVIQYCPHTPSKSAGQCSPWVVAVCDLWWHGREWPGEFGVDVAEWDYGLGGANGPRLL